MSSRGDLVKRIASAWADGVRGIQLAQLCLLFLTASCSFHIQQAIVVRKSHRCFLVHTMYSMLLLPYLDGTGRGDTMRPGTSMVESRRFTAAIAPA